ncbi:hypothetical protein HNP40_000063 [Mycobacteroides chelonae]|nr:hypothetical protein [Mycobacteroides chelonae]
MSTTPGDPAQFGPHAPGYASKSAADVDPIELPGVTIRPLWKKALVTTLAPGRYVRGEDDYRPGP